MFLCLAIWDCFTCLSSALSRDWTLVAGLFGLPLLIIAAEGSSKMTSAGSSSSEEAGVAVPDEEGEAGRGSKAPARLPGAGDGPTRTQSSGLGLLCLIMLGLT